MIKKLLRISNTFILYIAKNFVSPCEGTSVGIQQFIYTFLFKHLLHLCCKSNMLNEMPPLTSRSQLELQHQPQFVLHHTFLLRRSVIFHNINLFTHLRNMNCSSSKKLSAGVVALNINDSLKFHLNKILTSFYILRIGQVLNHIFQSIIQEIFPYHVRRLFKIFLLPRDTFLHFMPYSKSLWQKCWLEIC